MKRVRIVLWVLVAFAAVGFLYLNSNRPEPGPMMETRPDPNSNVTFGGPFELVDGEGRPFSSTRLAGRPHAVFFGFTNCPDICPTTLSDLVRLREDLGGDDAFEIVFISVDPNRDGPKEVGRYADLFDSPIIGLTGTEGQVEAAMEQFGIVARRDSEDPETYGVDHTANVFLMDRNGEFVSTISPEEPREVARQKLERIAA
ncbi:SCO family protein [Sphingomicrobium sp. XHP0239]|uniref:SCO family protein n=1 Tax=Sphingomicrobium maritimum TaxID=3133972 RepID=UPI0031CC68B1